MITARKLEIYHRFRGDADAWARVGTAEERGEMADDDWRLIDTLVQSINQVENGLASDAYAEGVHRSLRINCDSEETLRSLLRLASSHATPPWTGRRNRAEGA